MKALFANMDLYKGILLASVVLMPAAAFWGYQLDQQVTEGNAALTNLRKRNGDLEQIGQYMEQIKNQQTNKSKDFQDYTTFFDTQVYKSAKSGLKEEDFKVAPRPEVNVTVKPGGQTVRAKDIEIEISFAKNGKERFPLSRAFINQVMQNCEGMSQIWKLRELKIRSQTMLSRGRRTTAPPPEIGDDWLVERMVFARREPLSSGSR